MSDLITIVDRPYQIFVFGKYNKPKNVPLTPWQQIVRAKVKQCRKVNPKEPVPRAAKLLGISANQCRAIVTSIREKGHTV